MLRLKNADAIRLVVNDEDFWRDSSLCVKFCWPAMDLLRVCDSRLPASGRLYQLARDVLERMEMAFRTGSAPLCAPDIIDAFKRRMKDLVHDFHRAARVVNPEYKETGVTRDSTLTGGLP